MKVYQAARKSPSVFKSLTGLKKSEFDKLVLEFKPLLKKFKPGRPHTLFSPEHSFFFMLFYYRHYCTQELMAFIFRVDQSQISRWIKYLQLPFERCTSTYLDKARKKIDSLKELVKYNPEIDVILDCTERPVLTHKNSKELFSGKKKFCTVKNQVCVRRSTKEIVDVSNTVKGARHDFYYFKQFKESIPSNWNLLVDRGYIKIQQEVTNTCFLPYKAEKNFQLENYHKQQNKLLSSQRCRVEHVFAQMKQFKILSDEFRGSSRLSDSSFKAIAGIYNFRRQSRKRNI